jgi:hypothetical protein
VAETFSVRINSAYLHQIFLRSPKGLKGGRKGGLCVAVRSCEQQIFQASVLSPSFLVSTAAPDEDVLGKFVFDILHSLDSNLLQKDAVNWRTIKAFFKHYVEVHVDGARPLHEEELKSLQCMLFLSLVREWANEMTEPKPEFFALMEQILFGDDSSTTKLIGINRIRYRLLHDDILDLTAVTEKQFLKPVSHATYFALFCGVA